MLNLDLYIHSTGRIAPSPNETTAATKFLCAEPDYSAYINPMQLRRMSKAVRMGIGASKTCLDNAGIAKPDAISVGTAMGCLQDTEFFLAKMVTQEEKMLTPTAFIQSTHNTVGGQIALLAGCHGHNMTFVHRGHSFEHAVINTKLYLADHPGETVLTGAIDELTNGSHDLMQKAGFYTADPIVPSSTDGIIAGEGATFFMINGTKEGSQLRISCVQLVVTTNSVEAISELLDFVKGLEVSIGDIDLVLSGISGDQSSLPLYQRLSGHFTGAWIVPFKQECGEYATAAAYAMSIAISEFPAKKKILVVNNYCDHYSFWFLERS